MAEPLRVSQRVIVQAGCGCGCGSPVPRGVVAAGGLGSCGADGGVPGGAGIAAAFAATFEMRVMRFAPASLNQRLPCGSTSGESVRLLRAVGRKAKDAWMLPSAAMVAFAIWSPYSSAIQAVPARVDREVRGRQRAAELVHGPGGVGEALGRVRDRLGAIEVADRLARLARVPDAALAIERDAVRQRRRRDRRSGWMPPPPVGGCAPGVGSCTGFGIVVVLEASPAP